MIFNLKDKKWPSSASEDDLHNIQAIIDSLSMDILHQDISHIQAQAICSNKPDLLSLEYLLDIMRSIQEWISSRLDSMTLNTDSSSSISRLSPIKNSNDSRSHRSLKSQTENKIRPNKSVTRNSSTTNVSSLSRITSQNKSQTSRNSSPIRQPSFSSRSTRQVNLNLARSSSTPRSGVRSISKEVNHKPQRNNLNSIRSSSIGSLNSTRSSSRSSSLASRSNTILTNDLENIGEENLLKTLINEFPDASVQTLNELWTRYSKQIDWIKRAEQINSRNGLKEIKLEKYIKEAYEKQKLLVELMRKELVLAERLEKLKKQKEAENLEKAKLRERRTENARVKKYYDEIRMQEKSRLLKQKTSRN